MRAIALSALLMLVATAGMEAGQKTLALRWSELPTQIAGKHIRVILADGVRLVGRAISVASDSLTMDLEKSSDEVRFHDTASLRRQEIAILQLRKQGWKWKVIAPVIGLFSFGLAGAAIGDQMDPHGFIISDGAITGATVGVLTGVGAGLVVGWLADRHYVKIDIDP